MLSLLVINLPRLIICKLAKRAVCLELQIVCLAQSVQMLMRIRLITPLTYLQPRQRRRCIMHAAEVERMSVIHNNSECHATRQIQLQSISQPDLAHIKAHQRVFNVGPGWVSSGHDTSRSSPHLGHPSKLGRTACQGCVS